METKITLGGSLPVLSARFCGGEQKFLYLSFHSTDRSDPEFVVLLNRIEAFTLWNFLDEALEIPLNQARK